MTTATTTAERYMQFVTLVATSPELNSQLEAASDSAGIVKLAAANGYLFTIEELQNAAHAARLRAEQAEGELSEQDLEAVAGGLSWSTIKKAVHAVRKVVDAIDDLIN